MFTKKQQEKIFQHEWKGMEKSLEKFCCDNDPERLHRARVHIKKIKALCFFFRTTRNEEIKKHFGHLKKLFRAAGELRDQHVQQEVLNQTGTTQQEKMKAFCRNLREMLKKAGKTHDYFLERFTKEKMASVRNLLEQKLLRLESMLEKALENTISLHDCRKELKPVVYMLSFMTPSQLKTSGINHDYLDKLQETIGTWHDLDIALKARKNNTARKKLGIRTAKQLHLVRKQAAGFRKRAHVNV